MRARIVVAICGVAAALLTGLVSAGPALAQSTIKVGIIHSLSGTMAISETALKDTMLYLIDQQNRKGGVLGRKLEAVVVDPASNWPLFAQKARELITTDKVSVMFGGYTSVSRKSMLPVLKELDSILFYPAQFEGEESERNVFYTGAAPNQQAIPAVDYLMSKDGGEVKRWVLAGTDYVYPRTTNKILEAYLRSKGVAAEDIMINYTPFGYYDWKTIVADIKKFGSAGKKTAVVSTINGDANVSFYKELGNQGIKATDIPVVALSVGEEELAGLDTRPLVGHLAAWNYFQSIKTPENLAFINGFRAFVGNPKRVTNDAMEAHAVGFAMWVKAVEKAGSFEPDKVIAALPGTRVPNLTGGAAEMGVNHYTSRPLYVGEIRADGQFDVVWKTAALIPGDAWSKQLEGSKDLIGDWVGKQCGNFNVRTNKCGDVSTVVATARTSTPPPAISRPSAPPPVAAVVPPPSPPPVARDNPQVVVAPSVIQQLPSSAATAANFGRRVALVVGNSNYKNVPALPNPARDAAAVGQAFRNLGFQKVTVEIDLTREKLTDALRNFAADAESADWAVVYYAGHGLELGGVNYLIPVDARLQTDRDVDFEAVPIDKVMNAVDGAKKMRLVLLDACRDNPFAAQMRRSIATRSIGRGLAQVEPEAGTLVVYAAKHGQTALDGDGGNSPFVSALINRMQTPGLEIRRLFDVVRDDVMDVTNRRQQPFSYGSVSGSEDFYFVAAR